MEPVRARRKIEGIEPLRLAEEVGGAHAAVVAETLNDAAAGARHREGVPGNTYRPDATAARTVAGHPHACPAFRTERISGLCPANA